MPRIQSESLLETVQENRLNEAIPMKKDQPKNLPMRVFSRLISQHLEVGDKKNKLITQLNLVQKYRRDLLTYRPLPLIRQAAPIQLDTTILRLRVKHSQAIETDRPLLSTTVRRSLKVPLLRSIKSSP